MSKRTHILEKAARLFYERGARKTSFGEIAKEAGISRPTLYTIFEDKNAVMIATIHHVSERALDAIRGQLADKVTAQDRLSLFTDLTILAPYEMILQSEDAADILSGHNDEGKKTIRETLEIRSHFLKEILTPFAPHELTEEQLLHDCRTFVLSGTGLKNAVASYDELQICLQVLSNWLLGTLQPSQATITSSNPA